MTLYLVSFTLHGVAETPPGDLYTSIYRDIENTFDEYCKDFLQFCLVRSENSVQEVKNTVRQIVLQRSNRFQSADVVAFSLGEEISISRGRQGDEDLRDFRRFFVGRDNSREL